MANFTMPFDWNVTNVTSFSGMARYANYVTNDMLGMFIVMIVFFVTVISLKDYETEKAVGVASILSIVVCGFLMYMHMLKILVGIFMVIAAILAMIGFYVYGRVYPQKPA